MKRIPRRLHCLYQGIGKQMCGLGGRASVAVAVAVADGPHKGGTLGPNPIVAEAVRC